jgi:hypothetical protein
MSELAVTLRSMQRAKTTLEDFVSSYFMFHGLDSSQPVHIFMHLPLLVFVEAHIYQLDQENEDYLARPKKKVAETSHIPEILSAAQKDCQLFETAPVAESVCTAEQQTGATAKNDEILRKAGSDQLMAANETRQVDTTRMNRKRRPDHELSSEPVSHSNPHVSLSLHESSSAVEEDQRDMQTGTSADTQLRRVPDLSGTPFKDLSDLLHKQKLLTPGIVDELQDGLEFWRLERKLCRALDSERGHKVKRWEVEQAVALKSFDYRVLNLLLYHLEGRPVNMQHFDFLKGKLENNLSDSMCDLITECLWSFVSNSMIHVSAAMFHAYFTLDPGRPFLSWPSFQDSVQLQAIASFEAR